jgi:hypothetical protein
MRFYSVISTVLILVPFPVLVLLLLLIRETEKMHIKLVTKRNKNEQQDAKNNAEL